MGTPGKCIPAATALAATFDPALIEEVGRKILAEEAKLKSVSKPYQAPADFVEDFQYYRTVEQSDLAPTLAALLGFPIPKNNLGAFIPDFLPFWPRSE